MAPRRLRVLLIEDNMSDVRLVHFLLEQKPVTLVHADRLATGLEYCAAEEIHLALLDLSLPDSTGTETYERFCAAAPEIPVIILTGLSDEETALQLVHAGAQDYLIKGKIESEALVRAMQYAVERTRLQRALTQRTEMLEASLERLKILREIDTILLTDLDLARLADAALERLRRLIGCPHAWVTLFDWKSEELSVLAFASQFRSKVTFGTRVAIPPFMRHRTWRVYYTENVENQNDSTALRAFLLGEGIQSHISLLLQSGHEKIGTLDLGHSEPYFFSSRHIEIASDVADQLAVAVRQAQLYQQVRSHSAELEQRVARRTVELEAATTRLRQIDEIKSQFIVSMADHLRVPIDNLQLQLQTLKNPPLTEKAGNLEKAQQQVTYLKWLIDGVVDFINTERQYTDASLSHVDINSLVLDVVASQRDAASKQNLSLHTKLSPSLPFALGNEAMLRCVLDNLLQNAFCFTPSGGSVYVETWADSADAHKPYACFSVRDTGSGIYDEELPFIFDRFFRGQAAQQSETPGVGLGLALCREIVSRLGGQIDVKTVLDVGSTFIVKIPLPPEHALNGQ